MNALEEICTVAARHVGRGVPGLPRVRIYCSQQSTDLTAATIYEPVVCLVLRGSIQIIIGERALEYSAGDCMIVTAEAGAMAQVYPASTGGPYMALSLYLDPALISSLLIDIPATAESSVAASLNVSNAAPALLDAWRRMVELLDRPNEIPVLASHLEHEILFRVLMSPQGSILRQIADSDSRFSRIRRAMSWIRENYAARLSVEAMAAIACMSKSVFHRRFKAVTGVSPLQYQKHVRLNEARRKMVAQGATAALTGFAVGYESASQFSREYKRLFGKPPCRDAAVMQAAPMRRPLASVAVRGDEALAQAQHAFRDPSNEMLQ